MIVMCGCLYMRVYVYVCVCMHVWYVCDYLFVMPLFTYIHQSVMFNMLTDWWIDHWIGVNEESST